MRLDATQQLRFEQQMKLSPRIIQAMEILQLPVMALQERIDAELQSNPVLEMHVAGVDEEAPPQAPDEMDPRGEQPLVVDDTNGNRDDFERLAEFEDEYGGEFARSDTPSRPAPAPGERDRKMDAMANTPAPAQSLAEYLMEQWRFVEVSDGVRRAGRAIIDLLEDDGYLRTPLEQVQAGAGEGVTSADVQTALRLVQTLDPRGVAARDLSECLTIQLAAEAQTGRDVSLEMELVRRFLRDIEMNRLPQIAKRTGRTLEQIKAAIESISHLTPRPGTLIGQHAVPVILPDIVVRFDEDGELVVSMPEGNSPQLYVSKAYRKMVRDRGVDRSARQFLRNNIRSAQWLISAIEQRRETVLRVVVEVFKVQREFLDHGREALKPLPMADVAEKVGVHVATVSRAVAGKYVDTPRGIFPLRMFFSGGTTTAEGDDVSWDAVKARLKEIVDGEDKSKPLNDDQLAEELRKHGIDIARRTIAKYRGLLDIPPARKRRQY
ncbi:MAG TPA: RNA polymerase sigma-54 factor [Phycisphaerales bacterium]|nr:RNA polymerase sigma-54 factor [Phycisphaerales bacterium]